MRLYFLRHGIAQDLAPSDYERKLTPEGVKKLEKSAQVIERLGLEIDYIFTSPRVRAVETAQIVATQLQLSISVRDELNFQFSPKNLPELLNSIPSSTNILMVGHEPTFSTVIESLTGARVDMKKGSLARIDITRTNPLSGVLVWLVAPKVFEALA
jgi:phosphohistidine phosphatase